MEFTADVLERLDKQVQDAKKYTKKQAKQHLQKVGIITAKGKLAAPYQGDRKTSRPKLRKQA